MNTRHKLGGALIPPCVGVTPSTMPSGPSDLAANRAASPRLMPGRASGRAPVLGRPRRFHRSGGPIAKAPAGSTEDPRGFQQRSGWVVNGCDPKVDAGGHVEGQ